MTLFNDNFPCEDSEEVEISCHFILSIFAQMNKLWVRSIYDDESHTNSILSTFIINIIEKVKNLNGINLSVYQEIVLPFLLKQIQLCRFPFVQEFLLKTIKKLFSLEYHLGTLELLFPVFSNVAERVPVGEILSDFLNPFLRLPQIEIDHQRSKKVFQSIGKCFETIFISDSSLKLSNKLNILKKVVNFWLKVSQDCVKELQILLTFGLSHVELYFEKNSSIDFETSHILVIFLEAVLNGIPTVNIFNFVQFTPLCQRLHLHDSLTFASDVCELFINKPIQIASQDQLKFFLSLTSCLAFNLECPVLFFSTYHLINGYSIETNLELFSTVTSSLKNANSVAIQHSFTTISMISLSFCYKDEEVHSTIFKFILDLMDKYLNDYPETVFQIAIQASKVADYYSMSNFVYNLFTLALNLFSKILKFPQLCQLINAIYNSSLSDIRLIEPLVNLCVKLDSPIQSVSSWIHCSTLLWKMNVPQSSPVYKILHKALEFIRSLAYVPDQLNSLFILLSFTTYGVESQIVFDPKWIPELTDTLNDFQEIIFNSNDTEEKNGFLANVRFIKQNKLFSLNENK